MNVKLLAFGCLGLLSLFFCSMPLLAQSSISGDVQIHPGGQLAIYDNLSFLSGYVISPRNTPGDNLSFQPGSSYSGASDASHVNGYAEKVGNTAFLFPVGNGTLLRPVGISAPASASAVMQAAYFSGAPGSATLPSGAPFSPTALGTGVTGVSPVEYWDINGSESINLTLTWNAASNLNTLASGLLTNLIVVGWNGTAWVKLGSGVPTLTGALSGTGTITVSGIIPDTYQAITFGQGQVASLTVDCSKTIITAAPQSGSASQHDLTVTINVSTPGSIPVAVSGSGMYLNGSSSIWVAKTGLQTLHIPVDYDGSVLGTMTYTLGTSTCTADLTVAPRLVISKVWTQDCVETAGPVLK